MVLLLDVLDGLILLLANSTKAPELLCDFLAVLSRILVLSFASAEGDFPDLDVLGSELLVFPFFKGSFNLGVFDDDGPSLPSLDSSCSLSRERFLCKLFFSPILVLPLPNAQRWYCDLDFVELLGGSLAGDFMVAVVVLLLLLYEGANNWRGDCCRFICCPSFEVSLLVLTCALLGFL